MSSNNDNNNTFVNNLNYITNRMKPLDLAYCYDQPLTKCPVPKHFKKHLIMDDYINMRSGRNDMLTKPIYTKTTTPTE